MPGVFVGDAVGQGVGLGVGLGVAVEVTVGVKVTVGVMVGVLVGGLPSTVKDADLTHSCPTKKSNRYSPGFHSLGSRMSFATP